MKVKRAWIHESKFRGHPFSGSYERDKDGERLFVLTNLKGKRKISFESPSAAKKLGWVNTIL